MASKRRIGGHFGSAVGASTKRQRVAGWREELDDEIGAQARMNGAQSDDSESAPPMDPGTPLPSESEAEAEQQPASEAAVQVEVPVPEKEEAPREQPKQDPASKEIDPTVITLELVIGDAVRASAQVLLSAGLSAATEERLAVCAPPDGARVERLASPGLCMFAGHKSLPQANNGENGHAEKTEVQPHNGEIAHVDERVIDPVAEEPADAGDVVNCSEGLLCAPLDGPGLAVTLGQVPELCKTHTIIGPLLSGRRMLKQLHALVPLCGDPQPQLPVSLRVKGPASGTSNKPSGEAVTQDAEKHPYLELQPATVDRGALPFALEPQADPQLVEELELADLSMNARDGEIAELKQKSFSRERQEGVAKVSEVLQNLASRLQALDGLDENLSFQRSWQLERSMHLQRILKKLQ